MAKETNGAAIKPETAEEFRPSVESVKQVSNCAILNNIRIVKAISVIPKPWFEPNDDMPIETKIKLEMRPGKPTEDGLSIFCDFGIRMTEKPEGDDAEDEPGEVWKVEAVFLAEYTIKGMKGFNVEDIASFVTIVVYRVVWPYWREYVQSQTSRMGIDPILMPLVVPAQRDMIRWNLRDNPIETKAV